MSNKRGALLWIVLIGFSSAQPGTASGAEGRTGEQIFHELCARCHGTMGEGTKENYPYPLAGRRSVAQLARLIAKTMPEDDPGKCVGDDAEKVAAYIYQAFYSKDAQARNRPPRIELTRLTVRQYQSAVADLIETFRTPLTPPSPPLGGEGGVRGNENRGLRGEYFKSRRFRNGERDLERV